MLTFGKKYKNKQTMLKQIHSYVAYIALALVLITVINAFIGWIQNKKFSKTDRSLGLFALIAVHIQLVIGIVWYVMSFLKADFSIVMKDASLRLLAVEHPLMMLIGVVLITIGWSKHKKKGTDVAKFKTFAIFYGLTLLFFLSRIPWKQWLQ